jgi:glycosyltransferase involved in cell wall biosynthesis
MGDHWKGRVLFVLDPRQGYATAKIRGLIYREILNEKGWYVEYVSISSYGAELEPYRKQRDEILSMAKNFDIVYLLKVNSYSFVRKLRKSTNAKIVFDLTDALWRRNLRKGWIFLEEILELSDAVFSENEYVCEYGRRYNKNVISLAACTQTEKFLQQRNVTPPRKDDKVVIGWIGSQSTIRAIFSILQPLERLFAKYPHLELRILGCPASKLKNKLRNIRFTSLQKYSEDEMVREAILMDIGIFPAPVDIKDYRIRGALKGMIYMSAGIPAVCLNAGDATRIIEDGVNGMLVNDQAEWESKLEALIANPELRKTMGQRAQTSIQREHSLRAVGNQLADAFDQVLTLPRHINGNFSLLNKFRILLTTFVRN